ncbi:MAG: insulinase family protein [Alphaproteobacteria bacterium]|nr:insulinase family protein [Alphaproteobacteria bacterium]
MNIPLLRGGRRPTKQSSFFLDCFATLAMTVFVLFIILPAHAADKKILDIQEVTSPGGLKAWLVEDHTVPVIALDFAFRGAGAINDPADKQGLSRMLSNTMDEGAGDIDSQSFQKELRDLSISLHFSSGRDDFGGSVKTLTRNKARAFELLRLALTSPRFDAEPVERMRAANQSRVRSSLSDPDWIAARLLNDRAFAGHPYAQNSGGTLTTLAAITPEDLRNFHKNHLGKNDLVVAVAGDLTKEELASLLDTVFGAMPNLPPHDPPPAFTLQNAGTVTLYKKDIPQTIVEIMQPGIDQHDPDYHLAQIMNFVLGSSGFGSRLTDEIREKRGLTYGIYTSFMNMRFFNGMTLSTSTENKSAAEVLSLIKSEWAKMKAAPITEKELQDAQSYLIGSLPLALTSTDDISGLLLSLQTDDLPIDYLERREAALRAATPAEVQRVAQKILDESKMTAILVGQPVDLKDFKTAEKIPNAE